MTPSFYDFLINIIKDNGWVVGPQSTGHHDHSKCIDFDKVEQLRQECHTEYPDSFSKYATQYFSTMEENGWWIKVCPQDIDNDEEEDEAFDDINEMIEYLVDIHLYGYDSDEPEVIDLTGDNDENDPRRNLQDEFDNEV